MKKRWRLEDLPPKLYEIACYFPPELRVEIEDDVKDGYLDPKEFTLDRLWRMRLDHTEIPKIVDEIEKRSHMSQIARKSAQLRQSEAADLKADVRSAVIKVLRERPNLINNKSHVALFVARRHPNLGSSEEIRKRLPQDLFQKFGRERR